MEGTRGIDVLDVVTFWEVESPTSLPTAYTISVDSVFSGSRLRAVENDAFDGFGGLHAECIFDESTVTDDGFCFSRLINLTNEETEHGISAKPVFSYIA